MSPDPKSLARQRIAKLCAQRALDNERDAAETVLAIPEKAKRRPNQVSQTLEAIHIARTLRVTPEPSEADERAEVAAHPDRLELIQRGLLAEGGMGQVRLAEHVSLGREVAVKSLLPRRQSEANIEALVREARIVGRLEHPNIVPIHALGWDADDGPVLVMKRVEGDEWGDVLENEREEEDGRLSEAFLRRHLAVLGEISNAIAFAHSRGVVHRDVKPANVMLGSYGEIYLVDWGVAHWLSDGPPPSGQLVGTPAYLAPEMVDGEPVGPATDVYLLGATLHRILTGENRNAGENMEDVLMSAWMAKPHVYDTNVPAALAAICNRACSRRPEDRYPSADAFRAEIDVFLRYRSATLALERATKDLIELKAMLAGKIPRSLHHAASARFIGARYGFEDALREWPDNAEAKAGVVKAIELMARYEFERGDLHAASALVEECDTTQTDLKAAIEAEMRRREEVGDAHETLAQLARNMRLEGEGWGRSLTTAASGALTFVFMLFCGYLWRNDVIEITPIGTLFVSVAAAGGNALALRAFRRVLTDAEVYRRLMTAVIMMLLLLAVAAALGEVIGIPFEHLLVTYLMVFVAVTFTLATVVDERVWTLAALALLTAVVAATHLNWVFEVMAVTYAVGAAYLAWVVRPREGAGEAATTDEGGDRVTP